MVILFVITVALRENIEVQYNLTLQMSPKVTTILAVFHYLGGYNSQLSLKIIHINL